MLQIDLRKILRDRKAPIPGLVARLLEKVIHQDELNDVLRAVDPSEGSEFADRVYDYFGLSLETEGLDDVPEGRFVFASNHPLGGLDGIGLIKVLGKRYGDERLNFLVNDMLMHVEPLRSVFLPINKYGAQGRHAAEAINEAYAGADSQILVFPAGLVSRLQPGGEIADLKWQKSFVVKALESKRGIVPVTFEGLNRKRFYRLARWRRRLGIKLNIEQAFLPAELCASRGKHFRIVFHKPIPYETLAGMKEKGMSPDSIAAHVRGFVYSPNSD